MSTMVVVLTVVINTDELYIHLTKPFILYCHVRYTVGIFSYILMNLP